MAKMLLLFDSVTARTENCGRILNHVMWFQLRGLCNPYTSGGPGTRAARSLLLRQLCRLAYFRWEKHSLQPIL
jgi:hypothetical protein